MMHRSTTATFALVVLGGLGGCSRAMPDPALQAHVHEIAHVHEMRPAAAQGDLAREKSELDRNIMATRLNHARTPGVGCVGTPPKSSTTAS